jgi:hypothetical protein
LIFFLCIQFAYNFADSEIFAHRFAHKNPIISLPRYNLIHYLFLFACRAAQIDASRFDALVSHQIGKQGIAYKYLSLRLFPLFPTVRFPLPANIHAPTEAKYLQLRLFSLHGHRTAYGY